MFRAFFIFEVKIGKTWGQFYLDKNMNVLLHKGMFVEGVPDDSFVHEIVRVSCDFEHIAENIRINYYCRYVSGRTIPEDDFIACMKEYDPRWDINKNWFGDRRIGVPYYNKKRDSFKRGR